MDGSIVLLFGLMLLLVIGLLAPLLSLLMLLVSWVARFVAFTVRGVCSLLRRSREGVDFQQAASSLDGDLR
jgi:membrane protein implicated in regulation of membrane protease activity